MSQVHAQARTTPLLRAEIKASSASQSELASRYNVSVATVRKWQGRDDPNVCIQPPGRRGGLRDMAARRTRWSVSLKAPARAADSAVASCRSRR